MLLLQTPESRTRDGLQHELCLYSCRGEYGTLSLQCCEEVSLKHKVHYTTLRYNKMTSLLAHCHSVFVGTAIGRLVLLLLPLPLSWFLSRTKNEVCEVPHYAFINFSTPFCFILISSNTFLLNFPPHCRWLGRRRHQSLVDTLLSWLFEVRSQWVPQTLPETWDEWRGWRSRKL